jgi:hypothetical protein
MPERSRKLPRDPNARAHAIVQLALGEREPDKEPRKNPAAVELGRLGGLKGGKARAAKLTKAQRSESARRAAALARWTKGAGA